MFFDSITKKCPIIKVHCYKKIQKCGLFLNVWDFLNLSIFVRDYSTRSPGTSHSKERYVTKPQTSHNNIQKTRPRYLNFERFYWGSAFARQKKNTLYSTNFGVNITFFEVRQSSGYFYIFYFNQCHLVPNLKLKR